MITSGTTKNNKWQRVVQRVAASNTTSGNEWQRVTTSDNGGTTNDNDCQNEWKWMKANESDFRFQNKTIIQCIPTICSATSFWIYNVKQNICRRGHRSYSIKKLLLKFSHYSPENSWRPATLLKRDSNTSAFLWILWNF